MAMKRSSLLGHLTGHDALNFALTNRIPRNLATQFMGWFSRLEQPAICRASIWLMETFAGSLDLHEAETASFASLHDCFTRKLKPGARTIDPSPDVLVSPCDGIVGACGRAAGTEAFQCKGSMYRLEELFGERRLADDYRDGVFVTLRLQTRMYHRFHAPGDCRVRRVTYFPGERWNVNPPALRRIDRLFCRNERAVVELEPAGAPRIALVAVGAVLVASIRFTFIDVALNLQYKGPDSIRCDAAFDRGEELGHFEHGSTILVFGGPGLELWDGVREGEIIRMGQPLLSVRAGRRQPDSGGRL